uniref:Sphingomyelin phosphodiesterase 4 n=1 Tax=Clytia hemisphaerica TaxID=252671 RepID=A0A7M5V7G6_9CNID
MSSSSSPNYQTPRGQSSATWSTPFSSFGTAPSSASIQHQSTMYRTSRGGSQSQSLLNPGDWTQKVDHLKKFFGDEYSPRKQFHTQSTPYGHLHNQRQQHISSPQFQKQSYQTLFENALQKNSIRDRCEEVTKVLQMVSVTELRELFPLLLHDLFGYQNLPNWGFHYLEPRSYPVDYNAMKIFLGPKGILFKIIDKLMTDHDAIFQLPFEILPSGISEAIMKNQVPLFYQHKMQNQLNGSIVINLNPTEYYFALFSYFVLHQKTLQLKSDWTGVEDVLYVHLFESYLNEYLPLHQADNTNLQTTTSLSSATSIKQHGSRSSMSSLWRSPDLHFATTTTNTKLSSTSSYVDHLSGGGNQSTDTETVLQLVTDFWLAFNSEEFIQKEEEYKLPSLDHSRMVRILIKYLHSYLNSCQKNAGVQGFSDRSPSEELQKLVIPSIVYDKLYSYLLHCFNHWPLDSSFRMILETWLSFIQPWRYQTNQNNVSTDDFDGDITSWRTFIQTNSHFYSGLLSVFLLRALKYDLMAIQDVQLIYRVAKVLSQPALMEILHEGIEDSMAGQGSYLSNPYKTESKSGFTSQSHQLQNNDSVFNGSGNTTLFNIENNRHALELCQQMSNTLMGIRHKICKAIDKEKNRSNTWLGYFREIFMMNEVDDFSCKRDENRLIDYLEHSCKAFANFFKV